MKKSVIFISIMTGFVYAGDFKIIVNNERNDYSIIDGFYDETTYSEWETTNINNCIPKEGLENNNLDDYYYGKEFNQIQTCQEHQERTATITRHYETGSEEIIRTYQDLQIIDHERAELVLGEHLEDSCKTILNNGYSIGTGMYHISTGNEPFEVRCDMETDGGGWTLIQSGTINQHTTNQDLEEYNKRVSVHEYGQISYNGEKPYLLDYLNRHTIQFTEFKVLHQGETGTYKNQVKLNRNVTTGSSNSYLSGTGIISYRVSNSSNPLGSHFYTLNNCEFLDSGAGHISCQKGNETRWETQNPWYQTHKVNHFGTSETNPTHRNTFGVHTCMRFLFENGTFHESCREDLISNDLFSSDCVGDLYWKNHITSPSCNYRNRTSSYYKWDEWVR